jgi:hypothetical protein
MLTLLLLLDQILVIILDFLMILILLCGTLLDVLHDLKVNFTTPFGFLIQMALGFTLADLFAVG